LAAWKQASVGEEFAFNLEFMNFEFLTFKLLTHLLEFIIIRSIGLIQTTGERVLDGWRWKGVLVDVQLLVGASSIRNRLILLGFHHLPLPDRPAVEDGCLV